MGGVNNHHDIVEIRERAHQANTDKKQHRQNKAVRYLAEIIAHAAYQKYAAGSEHKAAGDEFIDGYSLSQIAHQHGADN